MSQGPMDRRSFLKTSAGIAGATALLPAAKAHAAVAKPKPDPHYQPLANPISELQTEYDVIVIGSGYGGSVSAARLASGRKLAIFERGKEWLPGTLPQDLKHAGPEVRLVNKLGLYDLHPGKDMNAFVGNGLGGTSLLNANVVIRPDNELFDDPRWPKALREARDSGELDIHFARARAMIAPQSFPGTMEQMFAAAPKTRALAMGAARTGATFGKAELAVNLATYNGPNQVGVYQPACIGCGNCDSGCNTGAKNTLDRNYLPVAKRNGAKIFTQIEVDYLTRETDGAFKVHFIYREPFKRSKRGSVRAKRVVVAAGTLGTAQVLLRSREIGKLEFSKRLGQGFSGNADFLGFGYNSNMVTGVLGHKPDSGEKYVGPVILGIADYRANRPMNERFVMQEGLFPSLAVSPVDVVLRIVEGLRQKGGAFRTRAPLDRSMVYLGLGHDSSTGQLQLNSKGHVQIHWPKVDEEPIFKLIDEAMRGQSEAIGSDYLAFNDKKLAGRLTTVHPMGGCGMGDDADRGVVDANGQVFGQEGLYVADASLMPSSLGVNPLWTISAMAERIADHFA